jgi:glycerophosphoryl diester phosphodiesterase
MADLTMLAARSLLIELLCAGAVALANVKTDSVQPFHIQAHRGGGIALPENTLETFRWSWDRRVTPEADLRTTNDGVIVCFHDANLKRVVRNADGRDLTADAIEKRTLEDVETFDVGSFRGGEYAGQRVPTLASVFKAMKGRPERLLYIDIKNAKLPELAQLVKDHGVERQVIFTTPKHALIREWKTKVPESLTLLWNGGSEAELKEKMDTLRKSNFEGITHLQVHVRVGDLNGDEPFTPSSGFIQSLGAELEERGIVFQVLLWECKDQAAYERLLELGVDSFATDYPEITLNAVRSFRQKPANGEIK